jgi:Xaa-Pro aminopeptidase
MELDVVPAATLRAYTGLFGKDAEILDASPLILACRAVKSEWEVGEITRAAELHNGVFGSIPELLQGEVSSYELQCLLQAKAASLGHCGVVRMRGLNLETPIGIVLSGEEGAVPSHSLFPMGGEGTHPWVALGGSRRKIAPDTPIIADFLMSLSGYHADATRMAVKGRFPDEAAEIFASLRRVLRYAESLLRAGAVPSAVYRDVVELAGSLGLADGFMGPKELQVPFVGHGVGLEVNEVPVLAPRFDEPLASGTTLAVEPKYTHSRWGVIGVENTYVVREGGVELLTRVPEDVIAG